METSSAGGETGRLIEKLKSVRAAHAAGPPEALREALRHAIQETLGGLPMEESGRRLEQVRAQIVAEARQREERAERLEAEMGRLTSEVASLRAERDRLASENARLASAGPAPAAGGADLLEKFREGLRKMAKGEQVTPESLGLPSSEARFFRLTQELLGFALRVEFGVQGLLADVGVVRGMDTRIMKRLDQLIRDRFRACLDNQKGSIQALQETLKRNSKFLLDLNDAYAAAIRQGVPALLGEMDPQPILENNAGRFGMTNYEGAWRELSTRQNDLSAMTPRDTWERFFQKPFQEKLGEGVGPAAAG
jgi:hypothetical protein